MHGLKKRGSAQGLLLLATILAACSSRNVGLQPDVGRAFDAEQRITDGWQREAWRADLRIDGRGDGTRPDLVPGEARPPDVLCASCVVPLMVAPTASTLAAGLSQQFSASWNGVYITPATWHSSQPPVATINSAGLALAISPGQTEISATYAGATGKVMLIVTPALPTSLTVSPSANQQLSEGQTTAFTAEAKMTDNSFQDVTSTVKWTSSNKGVLTFIGNVALPIGQGVTMVSAWMPMYPTVAANQVRVTVL